MASLKSAAVESVDRDELRKSSNSDDSSVDGIPDTSTIRVTVVQSGRAAKFNIVERTVLKDGTWNEDDSTRQNLTLKRNRLNLPTTDNSGILRFKSEGSKPEFFLVALGVDTSARPYRWCDLKVDLTPEETAELIHPRYYTPGTSEFTKKKMHYGSVNVTSNLCTAITVAYYYDDGFNLRGVTIIIT